MTDGLSTGPGAPSSVVVGLSSGVDSSVAAWLLKQQGFRVIAVTLALAVTDDESVVGSSCHSPDLMARAKAIADRLGIPHYPVDKKEDFQDLVIDYFVSEYEAGRTPNPCAKCNACVRFNALLGIAERFGAEYVATGHYARLVGESRLLSRAVDRAKDQSYVLAEVDPAVLRRCVFPLGELTKKQVRQVAIDAGVADLVSGESQEICFVPDNRYREFLRDRLGERPGVVVDEEENVIGTHSGTYNYTVGQRKGLGQGGGPPLYVSTVDAQRRRVVVTGEGGDAVSVIHFTASAIHREPPAGKVDVQFRSMGKPVSGKLLGAETVMLDEPARGVAPGQTIVVYDGDAVVLGGNILSTAMIAH